MKNGNLHLKYRLHFIVAFKASDFEEVSNTFKKERERNKIKLVSGILS